MIESLVPTFGIENYLEKLRWLMSPASSVPREMVLAEGVLLGGVGGAAALMLLVSLFRRSAVAAVSFSFLAMTGLILAIMLGRLDFVPEGTLVLISCLYSCSILLFVTASLRVARENPFVGGLVLMAIAALLVGGAGAALNILNLSDGWGIARLGFAGTLGAVFLFLVIETIRFDKPSLLVMPGLICIGLSPLAMMFVEGQPGNESWIVVCVPAFMLAAGTVFAALSAQFAVGLGVRPARRRQDTAARAAAGAAAVAAVPLLREVGSSENDEPQPLFDIQPTDQQQTLSPEAYTAPTPPERLDVYREPNNVAQRMPAHNPQHSAPHEPAPRHEYAAVPETAPHSTPAPVRGHPAEPVSAAWGTGAAAGASVVADNEYVWDAFATQEVRVGPHFSELFGLPEGGMLTPDVLRDAVAPVSLSDFDEMILGGPNPTTGRFEMVVTTNAGSLVHLDGRRSVDHDGITVRIEARAGAAGASAAPGIVGAAALSAPGTTPVEQRSSTPMMARDPQSSPLTASRDDAGDVTGAMARGEIEAHFQPIVRLRDRKTVGFEALARWRQPNGNLVEAKGFVDDLLKADQGVDLARLVIERAASELSAWIAAEGSQGQFVSLNIAASDLPKADLADIVADAVRTYALPAGALVLELTEGRIQSSLSKALAAAKVMRAAGASLAIDDFGVGYSTLNRLSKFHFDLVKTDHSLIDDITSNRSKKKRAFFKTVLQTAAKNGSPVIAEGIEDEETAQLLDEMGCEFAQGFLFGRAEPIESAPAPAPQAAAGYPDTAGADVAARTSDLR